MRFKYLFMLVAGIVIAPVHAESSWQEYSYPESGLAFQLPVVPKVSNDKLVLQSGISVPTTVYSARQDNVAYSVVVANFAGTSVEPKTVINETEKTISATGTVAFSVDARVDGEIGRQLSINAADGSRAKVAIFFTGDRLYELIGRTLPPDAAAGSGEAIRFQESLRFISQSGAELRKGRPGVRGGPPGNAGPRRR